MMIDQLDQPAFRVATYLWGVLIYDTDDIESAAMAETMRQAMSKTNATPEDLEAFNQIVEATVTARP